MSVAAIPSPASRCKRLFEVEHGEEQAHLGQQEAHRHKRTRLLHHHQQQQLRASAASPGLRAGAQPDSLESAIASLLALFPGMDDKVVQDVLLECGSIDAAIKRLTDLKLSTDDATVAAATAAAAVAGDAQGQQQHQHPAINGTSAAASQQPLALHPPSQQQPTAPSTPDAALAAAAALHDAASHEQQQQQAAVSNGAAAVPEGPQTAEQWVEFLVVEMLASKDMDNARSRAAQVLEHFERFVKQRHKDEVDARTAELLKENAIFKRAVQIQAQRAQHKALQEEQQLSELRAALAHYQEQCRRLEVDKYSLALHLQQATSGHGGLGPHNPRNPDVY